MTIVNLLLTTQFHQSNIIRKDRHLGNARS